MNDILLKAFGALPHPDLDPTVKDLFIKAAKKGMTMPDIRHASGLSKNTVRQWYNGYRKPKVAEFMLAKEGIRKFKPKPKDCVIERMFKECGVNVNFVDV